MPLQVTEARRFFSPGHETMKHESKLHVVAAPDVFRTTLKRTIRCYLKGKKFT